MKLRTLRPADVKKNHDMSINVAIVEDNPGFRALIRQLLDEAPGYHCVGSCGNAEEALCVLADTEPQPDVILMDIQLPGLSGIDCVARLQQFMSHVPVIMLTVNNDPDRIFSALKAGAKGYLLKRTAPHRLLLSIQEVLAGGSPMSGEVARKIVDYFSQQSKDAETTGELSRREAEVLECLSQGYADKEIAARLSIGYETIRTHLKHIYEKLHVSSRTAAVSKYLNAAK